MDDPKSNHVPVVLAGTFVAIIFVGILSVVAEGVDPVGAFLALILIVLVEMGVYWLLSRSRD